MHTPSSMALTLPTMCIAVSQTTERWEKLKAHVNNGEGAVTWSAELELQHLSIEQKKEFEGTKRIRIKRPRFGAPLGITLGGDADKHPVVMGISDDGLAKESKLEVGDVVMSVNNKKAIGHIQATQLLRDATNEVHLRVKRTSDETMATGKLGQTANGPGLSNKEQTTQMTALFLRTVRLQRRQPILCFFSFAVPIALMIFLIWCAHTQAVTL